MQTRSLSTTDSTDTTDSTASTSATSATHARNAAASADEAARARRARFGALPEPIPFSAMVEEQPATPKAVDDYSQERSWLHYSCVALDLAF